jgi:acyl-homoserine-lactone acylase
MFFAIRTINLVKKLSLKAIITGAVLGVPLLLAACSGQPAGKSEILWDNWGVPHIQAENAEGVFYAFGWAQMESHGNLILKLYGRARGRAAEYWGEPAYESDRLVRTMGIPDRARTWYQAQREPMKSYLDSFVKGINDYAKKHEDKLAEESRLVLPIKPEDVLAHTQNVIQLAFIGSGLQRTQRQYASAGSNAWAIGPSRSANGHAMLLSNPHLPWSDLYLWFEAHLRAPGLNAYGATLIGIPVLTIAFNDHLGWTHTVNTLDGVDLYELTLYGHGYYYNGAGRNFTST